MARGLAVWGAELASDGPLRRGIRANGQSRGTDKCRVSPPGAGAPVSGPPSLTGYHDATNFMACPDDILQY